MTPILYPLLQTSSLKCDSVASSINHQGLFPYCGLYFGQEDVKKTTGGQYCTWASRSLVSFPVPSEASEQAQAKPLSDERCEAQTPQSQQRIKARLNWPAPANCDTRARPAGIGRAPKAKDLAHSQTHEH